MPQPQRVTIRETSTVAGVRSGPSGRNHQLAQRDPAGRWCEDTSFARAGLSLVLVFAVLTVSGCMTTAEYAGERERGLPRRSGVGAMTGVARNDSIRDGVQLARLQSPAAERAQVNVPRVQLPQPALPDTGLPLTTFGSVTEAFAPAPADTATESPATEAPPAEATTSPPAADGAGSASAPSPAGLSSISRNRRANRMAAGLDTGSGGMSAVLRNRIQGEVGAGGEPEYNYPDIHSDPAKTYHDRFGIDEDHDHFLFPWLMNLIFEDRWLLSEKDPTKAVQNQFRRRMKIDIRDPDPDTANFPNGAYTLPKGRLYIENSPVGFYGASKYTPRIYQWEYLLRYGLTDNLEFRIFSNGLTARAPIGKQAGTTGYSPLAFDFKANFWEENTKYHIPAMGAEIYLQTTFGSPAFNSGTQPSINLLFDQSLPLEINFEYNLGITGVQNGLGQTKYQFSYQWSFQREVFKDFDIFVQGFYNESSLPRLIQFRDVRNAQALLAQATIPTVTVVGVGAIWTVNDRLAIFGSYNFGLTPGSPRTVALTGFAVAF